MEIIISYVALCIHLFRSSLTSVWASAEDVVLVDLPLSELAPVLTFLVTGCLPDKVAPEMVKACNIMGVQVFNITLHKVSSRKRSEEMSAQLLRSRKRPNIQL